MPYRVQISFRILAICIAAVALVGCGDSSDDSSSGSNPTQNNSSNSGSNNGAGPPPVPSDGKSLGPEWPGNDDIDWRFNPDTRKLTVPAVAPDGEMLYVGAADGRVHGVDLEGNKRWSFETGQKVEGAPAVAEQRVYVGSWDGTVYGLDADDGSEVWTFETEGPIDSSPTLGKDGTIYVASGDRKLYALTDDGKEKWSLELPDLPTTPATLLEKNSENLLAIGTADGAIHCIAGQSIQKTLDLKGAPSLEIGVTSSDDSPLFVFGTTEGFVYGATAECTKKWSTDLTWAEMGGPAVVGDGFYIGSHDDYLRRIDLNGKEKWAKPTGVYSPIHRTPLLGEDKYTYSAAGNLTRARRSGETKILSSANLIGPPVVVDGSGVFGVTAYGHLVALDVSVAERAKGWFTQHGDNQRTGRLNANDL